MERRVPILVRSVGIQRFAQRAARVADHAENPRIGRTLLKLLGLPSSSPTIAERSKNSSAPIRLSGTFVT